MCISYSNHITMNRSTILKIPVILISLVMFGFQMKISLENLFNPPIIVSEKKLSITEIDPPMLTICPLNQVDEEKLKSFGYATYSKFLKGIIKPFHATNISFWKLFEQALTYDPYLDLNLEVESKEAKYNITNFVRHFYPKFGYCWELTDYDLTDTLEINIKGNVTKAIVLLTDKLQRTKPTIAISDHRGTAIQLDISKDYTYFVEIGIRSFAKPSNPHYCKDYIENEFEKCVDLAFKNFTIDGYLCLPPWLTSQNACTDMNWRKQTTSIFLTMVSDVLEVIGLDPIIEMKNFDEKNKCSKPCKEIRSLVRPGFAPTSDAMGIGVTTILFDEIAIFTEDIVSYNFSNFLLDLGSSVGLWFGISVIGLADLILDGVSIAKTAFLRHRNK